MNEMYDEDTDVNVRTLPIRDGRTKIMNGAVCSGQAAETTTWKDTRSSYERSSRVYVVESSQEDGDDSYGRN